MIYSLSTGKRLDPKLAGSPSTGKSDISTHVYIQSVGGYTEGKKKALDGCWPPSALSLAGTSVTQQPSGCQVVFGCARVRNPTQPT